MSESLNIVANNSPIPSLELYEWWFAAVFKHHRTSALRADAGTCKVCWLSAAAVVMLLIVEGLLVCCEDCAGFVLVCAWPNIEIGSCSPRTRIRCWWMDDLLCNFTAVMPFHVKFIVFLHTLQNASLSLSMTGLNQSLNNGSSSQVCENLHFPIFLLFFWSQVVTS